jgi:hypothetical protein
MTIQKAIKNGVSKFYFKIWTKIEVTSIYDEATEKESKYFQMQLTVKLFNKYGYEPIQTMDYTYTAPEKIVVADSLFDGLAFCKAQSMKDLNAGIANMIETTVFRTINN